MSIKRLEHIEQRIKKIKLELQQIGAMRPGSLTQQYRNPKKRAGAFYQLSYTHQMKSRTEYIRPQFVADVRRQLGNYKRARKLIDTWVALGILYSQIAIKLEAQRLDATKEETRTQRKGQ